MAFKWTEGSNKSWESFKNKNCWDNFQKSLAKIIMGNNRSQQSPLLPTGMSGSNWS